MTNKRSMNMDASAHNIDVDSLIAGADPVAAKATASSKSKAKSVATTSAPKTKQRPWADKPNKGRVNMPLYVTPDIKAMLDYLKTETGVPTQAMLRKVIEPAVKAEAEKVWKKND